MNDKLQELTERLYNEGLSKGRDEGEKILEEARRKADMTIAEAETKAAAIVADAEKQAEGLRSKVESELKTASEQCLRATRQDLENLLCGVDTSAALSDPEFLKKIILAVAQGVGAEKDLDIVLPESMKDSLEGWAASELKEKLTKGASASFSKKVAGGFTVAPRGEGWYLSFTDESFNALIREYLRPVTRKLVFGK